MASIKKVKKAEEALRKSIDDLEFVHATGSAEALARCENTKFDMIICDYYMPNINGLDILKRLKKKGNKQPFILIVDFQTQGIIVDALKAGADDTIILDIAFDEILPAIVKKNFRFIEMKLAYENMQKKLKKSKNTVDALTVYDKLTQLWDRRSAVKRLEEENSRAKRYNRPLSVLLIDIDHFTEVNRKYGREMGDIILQKIASLMKHKLRKVDISGRYDDDEFILILPETPMEKASRVAQRLLEKVSKHMFICKGESFHVTLSIGVSWFPRFGREKVEELLSSAGKALSQAKIKGHNCVKIAGKFS